jgi:hypothetical protein
MMKTRRSARSFTVDDAILEYLQRTRAGRSRSERVNELLRRGIELEQSEALAREAAQFFAAGGRREQAGRKAFAQASRRSITRDEE